MGEWDMDICMNDWSEERYQNFEAHLKSMEDEMIQMRRSKYAVAPSSFSYYLYEKKLERMRCAWEQIQKKHSPNVVQERYLLASQRIHDLIKQDVITEEDFPEEESIREMTRRHYEWCMAWLKCMLFMEPESK